MDWDDVKVFLAVAQAGSLAAGARRLRLSQATVWRRIRALDEALGARLFERRPNGYVLSAQGTTFLRALDGIDSRIAIARRRLSEGGEIIEGEVRIASPEALATFIAQSASRLAARHPQLRIELVSASPIGDFGLRDADLTIRCEKPHVGGFWTSRIHPIRFALYASAAYIAAHGAPRALDALAGHRLIDFDRSLAHAAPEPWREADLEGAQIVLRASSPHARVAAVRAGMGLAVLPCCLATQDPALVPVLGPEVVGELELHVCVNTELMGLSRIAEASGFVEQVLRACR